MIGFEEMGSALDKLLEWASAHAAIFACPSRGERLSRAGALREAGSIV